VPVTGCREITTWFTTTQAGDQAFRSELRGLVTNEGVDLDRVATLIATLDPRIGADVRKEFGELPEVATRGILRAWADAMDSGLAFSVTAVEPAEPIKMARDRVVQLVTSVTPTEVSVALSHVPGHHP
jgi:hypothetical protein